MTVTPTQAFLPVLLGSDINAYGMARSFWERYGVMSRALAAEHLMPTRDTRIIDVQVHPGLTRDEEFVPALRAFAAEHRDEAQVLLLVPCGDAYSELLALHQDELREDFSFTALDYSLLRRLNYKATFYGVCEEMGLPYPKTHVIEGPTEVADIDGVFPLHFPVALKPADSVMYLSVDFPGRKKAYIIDGPQELQHIIDSIYAAGYTRELILQDYIPGDDSHMRVLNAYVDHNHHVRMMSLGHPLLEDPTPEAVGNYMAILPEYDERIYQTFQAFLERIGYVGFANFDMKYDERDDTYRVFEINLRQGRASFYVTLNGQNLAEYLVRDLVEDSLGDEPVVYANADPRLARLWLGVPRRIFRRYAVDNPAKRRALELIRLRRTGTTMDAPYDRSLRRALMLARIYYVYFRNYRRFFRFKA